MMQKIIPHLWFDSEAEEAARLYTSLFKNSKIGLKTYYGKAGYEFHHQPEGRLMTIGFELEGQEFIGLNAGPIFKFTPAISFLVACQTKDEVDALWEKLSLGGTALMELGEYPFSEKYGWTQDRFGLSWQVMAMGDRPTTPMKTEAGSPLSALKTWSPSITQKIIPTFMFVGAVCGRAEEAVNLYTAVFRKTKIDHVMRYGKGEEPDKEGTIRHAGFVLEGQEFAAMDSAYEHKFTFNEAISFLVRCQTQAEIDHYWDKLSEGGDPQAQVCGWLKDKFGVSWQVSPSILEEMLHDPDKAKVERVTNAFLRMKKFDIGELKKAFDGR